MHGGFIRRDDIVELHGPKADSSRLVQAMFTHGPADVLPASGLCHHETGVGDMSAATRLIRLPKVAPHHVAILLGYINVFARFTPEGQGIFARHLRIDSESIARGDDRVEDPPDGIVVSLQGNTDFRHHH